MPLPSRAIALTAIVMLGLVVSGCSKQNQASNTVAMKDLEVTDGTISDTMTDLDGVRAQGTAAVPTGTGNNAAAASASGNSSAPGTNDSDAEAIPDQ